MGNLNLMKIFNILKSSIQSICILCIDDFKILIQHFHKCIYILSISVCSLSDPGFAPSELLHFCTQHSCKIDNATGASAKSKKVRDFSNGGGWVGGLQKNVHMTFLVDKIDM